MKALKGEYYCKFLHERSSIWIEYNSKINKFEITFGGYYDRVAHYRKFNTIEDAKAFADKFNTEWFEL